MDASLVLARILGLAFIVIGAGVLVNRKAYQAMIGEFMASPSLCYIGGLLALVFGLLVVVFHNLWVWDWPVILTVFGWLGVLKGIVLLVSPGWITGWVKVYQDRDWLFTAHGAAAILLGLFLAWKGFMPAA